MNRINILKTVAGLLAAVLLTLYSSASLAITAAGTVVGNTATVNYQVGGVSQSSIGSSPGGNTSGAGSSTDFTVDDKITFVVSTVDSADVSVTPAQTGVGILVYKITNNGNATHGFLFSLVNEANGTASPFGGNTDDFNAVTPAIFVSKTNSSTYTAGTDNVGSLFSLAAGASDFVFIVVPANTGIPGTQVNGDVSVLALVGQAAATGATYAAGAGVASTDQSGAAWTAGTQQTIFADAAGTDDATLDGKSSSRDAFLVSSAILTVTKTTTVLNDPTGDAIPHAIPGATMQYTITVANSASATANATGVSVNDSLAGQIPSNLTWVVGQFSVTTPGVNTGLAFTCQDNGVGTTTQAATSGAPYTAVTCDYNKTAATTITVTNIALKPGDTTTVVFQATIN